MAEKLATKPGKATMKKVKSDFENGLKGLRSPFAVKPMKKIGKEERIDLLMEKIRIMEKRKSELSKSKNKKDQDDAKRLNIEIIASNELLTEEKKSAKNAA